MGTEEQGMEGPEGRRSALGPETRPAAGNNAAPQGDGGRGNPVASRSDTGDGGRKSEGGKASRGGVFSAPRREKAVDVVVNAVKQALVEKSLRPGDRLPGENELAASLSVSRGSVREAMKILAALGVVRTQHGDGTYIGSDISDALLGPLFFSLAASEPEAQKLTELREMMELGMLRVIVRKADETGTEAIIAAFAAMEVLGKSGEKDPDVLAEADLNFHRAVAKAAGNELIEKIYFFILDYFKPFIRKLHSTAEYRRLTLALHHDLLEAVRRKDLGIAERALENFNKKWMRLL